MMNAAMLAEPAQPAFEPVRPRPLPVEPGALKLLALARRDLLSFWSAQSYRDEFVGRRFLRRWIFVANTPDTVEHVLVTRNDIYQRKSPYMRKALEPLLGDGLFNSDGETWRRRRAIEAPAFSSASLRRYAPAMSACALELAERWRGTATDRPVPVLPAMARLTAEIIGRTLFGGALGEARTDALVRGFSAYQAGIEQFDLGAFFGLPDWFPRTPQWRSARRAAAEVHAIVDGLIREHPAREADDASLLDLLLREHRRAAPGLTLGQARNEAVVIFMAGHETTANTLAWAWYLLACDPRAEARLHAELAAVLGGRAPGYDDVPALKYARAVIEESMRLYPPVPILSRECLADDVVRGRAVPAGSIMLVVPWLLHRHENLWERPHQFIPERFLAEWPSRHAKFSYVPFSAGPRICLGAAFGLTEAVLCLATLAQRYTLRLPPGGAVGYECRLTLRPARGLPMLIAPRA
jgi:cytochrome P450